MSGQTHWICFYAVVWCWEIFLVKKTFFFKRKVFFFFLGGRKVFFFFPTDIWHIAPQLPLNTSQHPGKSRKMDWLIWHSRPLIRTLNPLIWHSMIVWGCLSSFLAISTFFDSCAPVHALVTLPNNWDLAKSSKIIKNHRKNTKKLFFSSTWPEQPKKNSQKTHF